MQWEPNDKAWQSYIKLEERYNELERASGIYERWIGVRPIPKNWVAWAKFEEDRGQPGMLILNSAQEKNANPQTSQERSSRLLWSSLAMTRIRSKRLRWVLKPTIKEITLTSGRLLGIRQDGD